MPNTINAYNAINWKKLRYHPVHSQLWEYGFSNGRLAVIVAGRRSGKSELCKRLAVKELPIVKPWPDPLIYWILPTYRQAKDIAWNDFKRLIPKNWLIKNGANKSELSFTTVFGSILRLVGADKPQRMEGNPADWIFIDECSDQKPELYSKTVVPMLAERQGKCYRLGVPKRSGVGRLEFRKAYQRGCEGLDNIRSFHWKSAEVLLPEEIELLYQEMTTADVEEQLNASWLDVGSGVYYNFSNENINDELTNYNPVYPIFVGCDFNVNPMCWTLSHFIDKKFYVFDEVFLRNTNTQATLDFIHNKFRDHNAGWKFYGDATSRSKNVSASRSSYAIIKNDARFGQKLVYFPMKNPNCLDRYASVNKAFKTANGTIGFYVNSRCKTLIQDFNSVNYQEGTTVVEDYSGTDTGHMSDAIGYKIHSLMPYRISLSAEPVIHTIAG